MTREIRTLGRIVATRDLNAEEIEQVSGGEFYDGATLSYSGDCYCSSPPRADDCLSDG